ncbi:MAG: PIN domain nuclease [Geminicoccaceae bacterium]
MIVADTSVWIEFFHGSPLEEVDRLAAFLQSEELLMGDLVLYEILQGLPDDRVANRVRAKLAVIPVAGMVGPGIAMAAARNYRQLRGRGITVRKAVDMLIATFCIEHGHRLLHRDRDFQPMVKHLGLLEA